MHLLYVTVGTKEEAVKIARQLVSEKLLACANIINCAASVYWWEGKLQEEQEVIIIAKTASDLVERAIQQIKAVHSYDCPCIVAIKVEEGNEDFLKWVETCAKLPYS